MANIVPLIIYLLIYIFLFFFHLSLLEGRKTEAMESSVTKLHKLAKTVVLIFT